MPLPPILTAHLFPKIEQLLSELLHSLSPADWQTPTVAPNWKVHAVAAHLLDTQLRKLSRRRDGFVVARPILKSNADLVAYVNRLNEEGVRFLAQLSPPLLTSLMEVASQQSSVFHQTLDPFAPSPISVSWAGERESLNWFDTAREYTERWHHQQQIRLAVNRPGIETPELYHPVLDCFMRALPHTYREIPAPPGTTLQFDVSGPAGGAWFLERAESSWDLVPGANTAPAACTIIPQAIAWRIFTKGIDPASAAAQIQFTGNIELARHILRAIAIVG